MNVSGQNQAQDIIDAENARIDAKEQSYQNMQFGKKRVLELNTNFQNRTTAFNWIVVIFFITLAFIIFLLYLDRIVPGIHDYITIATYAVLFIGIAYCIYLYAAFIRRDPSDYDKIVYSPDANAVTLSPNAAAANASIQGGIYTTSYASSSGGSTTQTSAQIPRQVYINPVTGLPFDKLPTTITVGTPPKEIIVNVNEDGTLKNVSGLHVRIGSTGNVEFINPITGVQFAKLPTTITVGTPPKEVIVNVNEDGTLTNVSGLPVRIGSTGDVVYINPVTGLPFDKLPTTITVGTPPKEIIVNPDGTLESPKGTFVNIKGEPINPDGTVIPNGTTASGSSSVNAYGTTASGSSSLNAYGTTAAGNANVYGTTISGSLGSSAYNTTTPISMNTVNNLNNILSGNSSDSTGLRTINIPALITGEIFLGDLGRNTISVVDAKTIAFYYLNTSKDVFISLDGVNFTNKDNPNLIATVVTEGPKSSMNKNINGKGIKISIKGTNISYYFYASRFPALLKKNDVFIGPNGDTQIQVITQNRFNLTTIYNNNNSSSNDLNIISTYASTDGVYFIDDKGCSLNKAKIVLDGPINPMTNKTIYGQAIQLYDNDSGENIYFYYNGNTSDNASGSNVDSQPNTEFSSADIAIKANSQVQTTPSFFFSTPVKQPITSSSIGTTPYNSTQPTTTSMMPQVTTFGPTTLPATTFGPTTFGPTTLPATTFGPTTLPATTFGPTTLPATTIRPTTIAPTTLPATTIRPTTIAPTTLPATTIAPTTIRPTTLPATTIRPTTLPATTIAPTTLPATTIAPTTLPATTIRPTTIPTITDIPNPDTGFYKQNNNNFRTSNNISDYYNKIVNGNVSFDLIAKNIQMLPYVMYYFNSGNYPGKLNYIDNNNNITTFNIESTQCEDCVSKDLPNMYCHKIYIDINYKCSVTKIKISEIISAQATLILYYPFDTDVKNYASGTGVVNGSIGGTTVAIDKTLYKTGSGSLKQSNAGSTDSYFAIPTIPANTKGYTFAFWLNFKSDYWSVNVFNFDGGKIKFQTYNGSIYMFVGSNALGLSNFKNTDYMNKWNHFVWTIDKNGGSSVYLNGNLFFNSSIFGNFTYFSEPMNNNFILGGDNSIEGNVDDFRYYDGIITQDQITILATY